MGGVVEAKRRRLSYLRLRSPCVEGAGREAVLRRGTDSRACPMRSIVAVFLTSCVAVLSAAEEPARTPVQRGKLMPRVSCAGYGGQVYALYVPTAYDPTRVWPVVYCFDPMGDALRAIERFVPAAERFGYVIAASHNSRNADPEGAGIAAEAMIRDTHRVLRLDPQRRYAAGFSGGAVVACAVASALDFRGVIAVGGPMREETALPARDFALFGAAGEEDFNFIPMRSMVRTFRGSRRSQRFVTFPGRHEWLPAELAADALEWFDGLAMRDGVRPRDQDELERRFHVRLQRAEDEPDDLKRLRAYQAMVSDFSGLVDISEPKRRASTLVSSRAVKGLEQEEKRADRRETQWVSRLETAARTARLGLPPSRVAHQDARLPRWDPSDLGRDEWDEGRRTTGLGSMQPSAAFAGISQIEDGWGELEDLCRRASRAAVKDVAVRRALNGVFVGHLEMAKQFTVEEDYAGAVEALRVATTLYPNAGDALLLLARAYAMQGKVREGSQAFERALALGPHDEDLVAAIRHALEHPVDAVTTLQPFLVNERGVLTTSFGLALTILAEPKTGRIKQLIVKGVAEGSDAESQGLRPGDEIIAADGSAISTLRARFDRGSRFHAIFMRRERGDTVALKVISAQTNVTRSVYLRQDRGVMQLKPFETSLR